MRFKNKSGEVLVITEERLKEMLDKVPDLNQINIPTLDYGENQYFLEEEK